MFRPLTLASRRLISIMRLLPDLVIEAALGHTVSIFCSWNKVSEKDICMYVFLRLGSKHFL